MIRRASIADLARLEPVAAEFYKASKFLKTFSIDKFSAIWRQFIEADFGVIFIAEQNGEIQGTIGGVIHPDIYGEHLVAEEFFWYVKESERGCGIQLYMEFEDWAKRRGASEIQMVHLMDSMPEKLTKFYRSRGYEAVETRYSMSLAKQ
jgi:GNAT superfamily N-acetyltransferase